MKAYLVGALPRTEKLIKAYRDRAKNKIPDTALLNELESTSLAYIEAQRRNGFTYIIDGMLGWNDLLRPFASSLENVVVNGLSRWFDNNFFYKAPVINGNISLRNKIDISPFFHQSIETAKRKIVVPEPLTFAKLSINKFYNRLDELVYDVAQALALYLKQLGEFAQVQLTAPFLVSGKISPEDLELSRSAVEVLRRTVDAELMLHLQFGSAEKNLEDFLDFPVDVIGLDMFKTRVECLRGLNTDKSIFLGLVDGRNTLLEDAAPTVSLLEKVSSMASFRELHVGPNCELEHLPHEYALKKMDVLGEVVKLAGDLL
uniref:Methylcobalamin:homocysteine methyltransferase n=1 Tax=Caldiarchaeum subterraneum TaxID=311458 RepID=E6NAF0_CALS0|nr:methylcobalamin:homocysteine methyltransferase [Candidatus Caldarchaeum subterraneum]